jgi:hypothetical protein
VLTPFMIPSLYLILDDFTRFLRGKKQRRQIVPELTVQAAAVEG